MATDEPVVWSRSIPPREEAYLCTAVFPVMRPLSEKEYRLGPAKIWTTAARYSYVLDGADVYWCVEWEPGLLVVRFAPDGSLALTTLRSPNPQFGGREATDDELDNYDEDNEEQTRQYNLIFNAWDAQFDREERIDWEIADDETKRRFAAAIAHAGITVH